jgi:hypothetical protein
VAFSWLQWNEGVECRAGGCYAARELHVLSNFTSQIPVSVLVLAFTSHYRHCTSVQNSISTLLTVLKFFIHQERVR